MNKLCCFLSGGHRYSPSKVISTRNPFTHTMTLRNFCVKCSNMISFEMDDSFIDKEIEKFRLKEWFRWSGNGT